MSYTIGTLNDGVAPATTLMSDLTTIIDAHPAWVYVEEVTDGGTNVARVYRCLGTLNAHGVDFYMALRRTSPTSAVYCTVFETWTSAGALIGNFVPAASNTAGTGSFNASEADGSTPLAAQPILTLTHTGWLSQAAPAVSTRYDISVSNDRIVWATGSAIASNGIYAGLFETYDTSIPDPFPLCVCYVASEQIGNSTAAALPPTQSGYTRMTPAVPSARQNWIMAYNNSAVFTLPNGLTFPISIPETTTGRFPFSKMLLGHYNGLQASPYPAYVLRGYLRDVLCSRISGSVTYSNGDRFLIGSTYYVKLGYAAAALNVAIVSMDA